LARIEGNGEYGEYVAFDSSIQDSIGFWTTERYSFVLGYIAVRTMFVDDSKRDLLKHNVVDGSFRYTFLEKSKSVRSDALFLRLRWVGSKNV
jgi:hypothetical protein